MRQPAYVSYRSSQKIRYCTIPDIPICFFLNLFNYPDNPLFPMDTQNGINTGMPMADADSLHKSHHYEIRSTILRFISQQGQIDGKKYAQLVRFHASQIPDTDQYNKMLIILESHTNSELDRICREANHKVEAATASERNEALILACNDTEALIQQVMDVDLHIRERATVGVN